MITIQKVAGDSRYFQRDDRYVKGNYYTKESGTQQTWVYGADIVKERFGVDLEKVAAEKVFDELVRSGIGSKEMVGQDLTFSAPKDLSLLHALGNDELRNIAYQAHINAVQKTLEFADKNGYFLTRETHGGETKHVPGHGVAAIAFDHFISRSLDPQLHTHVVVLNQVARETDNQIRAIDFVRSLRGADRKQLDMIYKSEIARYLQEKGIKIEWDRAGKDFKITGITDEQRQAFSQREQDILKYAQEKGLDMSNQNDRQRAILETRASKSQVNLEDLRKAWQSKAEAIGLDINKIVSENKLSRSEIKQIKENYELKAESEAAAKVLGMMEGAFSKGEFYAQASMLAHQIDKEFDIKTTEKSFSYMLKTNEIVKLEKQDGQMMYATKDFVLAEKRIVDGLDRTLDKGFVSKEQFENDMKQFREEFKEKYGFWLSKEQEQALKMIFTSEKGVSGIQGYAGVGKSALFSAVKEYGEWLGKHYGDHMKVEVRGMAPTGQAAKVLEQSSGIKSYTAHAVALRHDLVKTDHDRVIHVVDEAGMVDAKMMSKIFDIAEKFGSKLILSGDINQFQSVEAGKAFDLLQRKGMETSYITGIRRQHDEKLREALKNFAQGNSKQLKDYLENKNWVHVSKQDNILKDVQDKYKELLEKSNNDYSKILVMAQTNKTVEKLNSQIREYLKSKGYIDKNGVTINVVKDRQNTIIARDIKYDQSGQKQVSVKQFYIGERKEAEKEFARGDRIIFLKNDRHLNVQNGLQGTIESIEKSLENNSAVLTVKLDNNQKITFSTDKYNSFDYSYAVTAHKAQGATVDRSIFVHEGNATKNSIYVAMTRAKEETHIFTSDKRQLNRDMERREENRSALEILEQKGKLDKVIDAADRFKQLAEKDKEKEEQKEKFNSIESEKQHARENTQEKQERTEHKEDREVSISR